MTREALEICPWGTGAQEEGPGACQAPSPQDLGAPSWHMFIWNLS